MKKSIVQLAIATSIILAPNAAAQTGGKTYTNTNGEASNSSEEAVQLDPARLTAAQTTIDYIFPLGTYERMMRGTMDKMMNAMMSQMMDMSAADMAKMGGISDKDADDALGNESMADMAKKHDPHFKERMNLTMSVMTDEMVTLMSEMEPAIRAAMTKVYARKYDAAQLGEMNTFFATETGGLFARDYMMAFVDDEMIKAMQSFVPEIMKAMPDIMKKVEKATEHLPAPKRKRGEDSSDDIEDS